MVIDKVKKIITIDPRAEDRLDDALKQAELQLKRILGAEKYNEYHTLPDGDDEKESIEYAEAYYTVYYLAIALKKIYQNEVLSESSQWGEGQIRPVVIDEIIKMRNIYRDEAEFILRNYVENPSGGKSYRVYVI